MMFLHTGQAEVQSERAKGQAGVIDAHKLQNGGLQVVNVHWILGDMKAEFIGLPER
ncbi:uncharacterized protein METZ01_LOCUS303523, partial [marine metagenome]